MTNAGDSRFRTGRTVVDDPSVRDAREWREHVRRQFPGRHDVLDRPIANHKIVRDDSPMASPPQSFGTHVRGSRARGRLRKFAHAIFEIRALRIVRVRSERGKLPRAMRRVVALRMTSAAEPLDPSILDSRALERRGKFRLVELRPSF